MWTTTKENNDWFAFGLRCALLILTSAPCIEYTMNEAVLNRNSGQLEPGTFIQATSLGLFPAAYFNALSRGVFFFVFADSTFPFAAKKFRQTLYGGGQKQVY